MIALKRMVGKICKGLTYKEYRCRCDHSSCTATIIKKKFITAYALFRIEVGVALVIMCGHRCALHNEEIGGAELSRHMTGEAVDIAYAGELAEKFTVEEIFAVARKCGFTFMKYYKDKKIIHLDVRELETY